MAFKRAGSRVSCPFRGGCRPLSAGLPALSAGLLALSAGLPAAFRGGCRWGEALQALVDEAAGLLVLGRLVFLEVERGADADQDDHAVDGAPTIGIAVACAKEVNVGKQQVHH